MAAFGSATLDLSAAQYRGFYVGFCNTMLWPLFHGRVGQAVFRREELACYDAVNRFFACGLAGVVQPPDTVWVHDYQMIPCGQALREAGVRNRIGFFLHIPFPPPFLFDTLPQGDALLRSFAAYDLIGVQTQDDADNLNQCFRRARIKARAEAFPIGIDPRNFREAAERADGTEEQTRLEQSLGGRALILGVDRLDYTKGLPERFRGFAQLLRRYPEHCDKVTFLQIAPVSRGDVAQYRSLKRELDALNRAHQWRIRQVRLHTVAIPEQLDCARHLGRLSSPCARGAGDAVARRDEFGGEGSMWRHRMRPIPACWCCRVLRGAASAMKGALLVNPFDPDEIADALDQALRMDRKDRRKRWVTMNEAVQASTAAIWAAGFLARLEFSSS